MNKLFFLLPLLLIPLFLSLYVNSTDNIAEATSHIPIKISKDRGSETWDLYGNATRVFKAGGEALTQTWDWTKQSWESYVLVDLGNDDYKVQSGRISTLFSGSTITHFNSNFTGAYHAIETLKLMRNDISVFVQVPLTFLDRTALTTQEIVQETISGITVNDTLDTVTITENYSTAYGSLQIIYLYKEGEPLKHTFTFTQTTIGTETYRLYHEFTMAEQEIEFKSFDPITNVQTRLKVKTPIEVEFQINNIPQLTAPSIIKTKAELGNSFKFTGTNSLTGKHILTEIVAFSDTDPSWNKFIEVYTSASTNPIIEFRYGDWVLNNGDNFTLDPDTFTSDDPTQDGDVEDTGNNDSCDGNTVSKRTGNSGATIGLNNIAGGLNDCWRFYAEWDITSIPDTATINDVDFKFDVDDAIGGSGADFCDYVGLDDQPSIASASTLWSAISDDTVLLNVDAVCDTAGDNKSLDMGSAGDTYIGNQLSSDWAGIGVKRDVEGALDSTVRYVTLQTEEHATPVPAPTLEITYTLALVYNIDLLDVFLSSSTTLESGTAICLNVDLKSASSCATALNAGSTYRFEIEVDNTGGQAGSPTTLEFRDVVANLDVLGTIPVGNILNSGCSTNTDWIESIVTDDAKIASGTTCSIAASGSVEFWMIVTLDADADDGTGIFFIDDGTINDVSTTTTFTINGLPNYTIDLLDVYESSSTTLDSGTSICLNVDLKSASSCGTALNTGSTYRFEIEVDNTGGQAGSPTTLEFRDVVATSDVFGVIPVGNILNSGCSTNIDWIESIVTDDVRAVSGTTCSIPAATGSAEFWMIVTIDHDASNGTGTFFINDGTINDVSTTTTFTLNLPITDLTATATSISQIDLSWTAPTGGQPAISYKIERETPVGNGFITLVNDTGTTTTTYSNIGLTTKIQYNYKVSAYSITKISSSSNEDNDVTFGVPDAVTSFSITISTASTLSLGWTAAVTYDSPVTGHKLERESPIGGGFSVISNDIGNVIAHTDTSLTIITEYNYRLTPLSALGDGNTNTASGKTVTTPPTNLLVLPNGTDTNVLLLTWIAPIPSTSINGYQIEREAPVGNGFSVIVANTTTTTVAYNDTGLVIDTFYNYRVAALTLDGVSQVSNTYSQTTFHLPDSVDDLIATPSTLIDIILTWTPPNKLYGYVLGYNINSTTPPTDNPLTVIKADTGTSAATFTATNLDPTTTYSFRVSAITIHGKNVTFANVVNSSATSEFIIGEINLPTESNPNTIPISFTLFTIDSDTKDLQVTFDSAMDLRCNFDYKFARSNTNYTSLTENPISGSKVYTNFTINNPDNEIIDINCVDQLNSNNIGRYRISQSSTIMPFITQATDFQSGVFGTSGQFGAIDLITLLVVILSMIGFNRVNPAVGVFLMIAMIGALSFYGIIGSWTIVLSGIALIAMLAIITVKKS